MSEAAPADRPPVMAKQPAPLRRMTGRDVDGQHRTSTPLERLMDLTFVVAFGVAASELSHMLAAGHVGAGITGFVFSTFAICLAWINFTWMASAFDTDDWLFRLVTMLQMIGVSQAIASTKGIPNPSK